MANYDEVYTPLVGSSPLPGTLQAPLRDISSSEKPAEEWRVDPALPVVGTIYAANRQEYVVIPQNRLIGVKGRAVADNNAGLRPILTTAGPGVLDANPIGFAPYNIYQDNPARPKGMMPYLARMRYFNFPFVNGTANDSTLYNSNLNGDILEGDIVAPDSYGRPVKFIPQSKITVLYVVTAGDVSGSAITVPVTSATGRYTPLTNLAIQAISVTDPTFAATALDTSWNTGGGDYDITATVANATAGDVLLVTADAGHGPQKMFGAVLRIQTGTDPNSLAKWLMRDQGTVYPFAPVMNPMYGVSVSDGEIELDNSEHSTDVSSGAYDGISVYANTDGTVVKVKLPHSFIDASKPITVKLSVLGNWTDTVVLQNAELILAYAGQYLGPKFSIEAPTGYLNLWLGAEYAVDTDSAIKVSYTYDGVAPSARFGADINLANPYGIQGLTDGRWTGGLPGMKPAAAVHPDGSGGFTSVAAAQSSGLMNIVAL